MGVNIHSIKRADTGTFITGNDYIVIMGSIKKGLDAVMIGDKLVTVEKDEIKDGCRITTVSVKD